MLHEVSTSSSKPVSEELSLGFFFFAPVGNIQITTSVVVWLSSGFQPLKRCRQFGSTWNRYMTIKMGDCAATACQVHLTQPQRALMFTQEGMDDLQPDTLSLKTNVQYYMKLMIPSFMGCGEMGEITRCVRKILTPIRVLVRLLLHCDLLQMIDTILYCYFLLL